VNALAEMLRCVRDTRSLVLALAANRFNSDPSCSGCAARDMGDKFAAGRSFEMRRLEMLSNTIFGVAMTLLAYGPAEGQQFCERAGLDRSGSRLCATG